MKNAFPKKCPCCGRIFATLQAFIDGSQSILDTSGLREFVDGDLRSALELYRNCRCGSTLMEFCENRRDSSPSGAAARKLFARLLDEMASSGIDADTLRRMFQASRSGQSR